jgi:hypothetical protein
MACVAAACGVLSPEEQLLTRYFEASRLNDTTVMARLSAVPFNPRSDGIIDSFEVERTENAGAGEFVTVAARVRSFDGAVATRQLVFTLTKRDDRWFIRDWRAGRP